MSVVPTGHSPFASAPTEIGSTHPSNFPFRVRFNSQPDDPNMKATNALVCLDFYYDGTMQTFPISMNNFATRLVVFEGDFKTLSVALYGSPLSLHASNNEVMMEAAAPDYQPADLLDEPYTQPLHPTLDIATMSNPTKLAIQLLNEAYPDQKLDGIIRHILAHREEIAGRVVGVTVRPEDIVQQLAVWVDDDQMDEYDWLDEAVDLSRSLFLGYAPAHVDQFVERLHKALGTENTSRDDFQRQCFFELLDSMSLQPDYAVSTFLRPGIFRTFVVGADLEEADMRHLRSSLINPHIARSFRDDDIAVSAVKVIAEDVHRPRPTRNLAHDVLDTVRVWRVVERLLSPSLNGDQPAIAPPNKDPEIRSWLLKLLSTTDAMPSLLLNILPIPSSSASSALLDESNDDVRILRELRAYQGIGSLAVVLCWAALQENIDLANRILTIFKLWLFHGYSKVIGSILRHPLIYAYVNILARHEPVTDKLNVLVHEVLQLSTPSSIAVHVESNTSTVYNGDLSYLVGLPAAFDLRDLSQLCAIRNALTEYCAIRRSEFNANYADTFGLFDRLLLVSQVLTRKLSTQRQEAPSFDGPLLNECVVLALHALRIGFPDSLPISRRSRISVVNVATEAFIISRLLQNGVHTSEDEAIALLLSLVKEAQSPMEAAGVVRTIMIYPFARPLLSLAVPMLVITILESLMVASPLSPWSSYLTAASPEIHSLLMILDPANRAHALKLLDVLDPYDIGISLELMRMQCKVIEEASFCLLGVNSNIGDVLSIRLLDDGFECISSLLESSSLPFKGAHTIWSVDESADRLASALHLLLKARIHLQGISRLMRALDPEIFALNDKMRIACALFVLRECNTSASMTGAASYRRVHVLLSTLSSTMHNAADMITLELANALARIAQNDSGIYQFEDDEGTSIALDVLFCLSWLIEGARIIPIPLTESSYDAAVDVLAEFLSGSDLKTLLGVRNHLKFVEEQPIGDVPKYRTSYEPISVSIRTLFEACNSTSAFSTSSTPRPATPQQQISLITAHMSPPLLRSPTITSVSGGLGPPSLHKKYSNQDFRNTRMSPTGAVQSSRPPSTHVDAFDNPTLSPALSPTAPAMLADSTMRPLQSPDFVYNPL